jgi:hypothetical protein
MMTIPAPYRLGRACFSLTAALLTAIGATPAHAQINFVDIFRTGTAMQTGNGNTLTSTGYYFSTNLNSINPGDFAGATVTYPGPSSPATLSQTSPTNFLYQNGFFATTAAMDVAFPMGTYTYNTSGGTVGAATTSISYAADHYPTAQPFLTGTDYTALQGANANAPFTFHLSSFAFDPLVSEQDEFLTIFDTALNTVVYDAGFLPGSTPSVTIGANTLQPGRDYVYQVIDSNRVQLSSPGAAFNAVGGFDLSTTGEFSTAPAATPEPGTLALLLCSGIGGALLVHRRRSR